ncbi:MAG: phosphonate C-P lyase system protein PhnH [Coriobacteriales bacterium]|nr:phosphonate C-P lyase system protein PhnH [Coriobacteriales bacterium]
MVRFANLRLVTGEAGFKHRWAHYTLLTSGDGVDATGGEDHREPQREFRVIMDAWANPGSVRALAIAHEPQPEASCLVVVARSLLDAHTGFCVAARRPEELAPAVTRLTRAPMMSPEWAAVALVSLDAGEARGVELLVKLGLGTTASAERRVPVVIECASLGRMRCDATPYAFSVSVPGGAEHSEFAVSSRWWHDACADDAPTSLCRFDLLLLSQTGELVALPRDSRVELLKNTGA